MKLFSNKYPVNIFIILRRCFFVCILFFFYFFTISTTQAQDLISTIDKKELNCKILRVTNTEIQYAIAENSILLELSIPLDSVSVFKYNHFKDAQAVKNEKLLNAPKYDQFMVSVDIGPGYKFTGKEIDLHSANIGENINTEGLGLNAGLGLGYFLSESWGVGLRYSQFNTWKSFTGNIDTLGTRGSMTNNSFTYFIGFSGFYRYETDTKDFFIAEASVGYINYFEWLKNNGRSLADVSGSNIAGYFRLGYDFRQWKHVAIGLSVAYTLSLLDYLKVKTNTYSKSINFDGSSGENLGRLDFTVGFRFYK